MVSAQWMLGRNLFMSAAKNTVRIQRMCVAALLCAIAILIPMISPVKIQLGPMSFTLGSHVAIFIAMFISPAVALTVELGATLGFLLAGFPPVVVLRALSQVVFVAIGAFLLAKKPAVMKNGLSIFLFGLVMGVMNVVPYAGPLIGGVVSVFVGIVTPIGGMTVGYTAVVIIGSLLILKGLDDFVLQPTLYSSRVKAHPLEIFLVILIAGSLAGILGMLLAIPSYTVLRVFAKEFFSQFSLVRKLTEKI